MKSDHANVILHQISHKMTFHLSFFPSTLNIEKRKSLHYLFLDLFKIFRKKKKSKKKDIKGVWEKEKE